MKYILALLLFVLSGFGSQAVAQDFWENSFITGDTRSDYDPGVGTGSDWLTLWYVNNGLPGAEGCLWDAAAAFSACPGRRGPSSYWAGTLQRYSACRGDTTAVGDSWLGCLTYSSSPYFSLGSPGENFWVVHANSDPSFDQCNDGPPGLSYSVASSVTDTTTPFALTMTPYSLFGKQANLYVDFEHWVPTCADEGWIPFLSLGAMANHGNNGPVAEVRWPPISGLRDQLSFQIDATAVVPEPSQFYHLGFYAIAEWPSSDVANVARMLFVDLSAQNGVPTTGALWNWPIYESMFWPGADVAVLTRADAATVCGLSFPDPVTGSGLQSVNVPLSDLFNCASNLGLFEDPMPGSQTHEVTGFHWFIESERQPGFSSSQQPSFSMHVRWPDVIAR